MKIKILQVFYGKNGLPYKDKDRQVHFPIVGTGFVGASNTTKIKFYYDELDNLDETTWVAVSKLPNGKLGSRVLESYLDDELNEHYALLELDNYYTQYKGDVFISLQGYQGGVDFDYDEENSQYEIHGTPTIVATGSIKLAINYANKFVGSGETNNINFQRILAALGTKLGIRAYSEHVEELPSEGSPDVFYVVNDDPNNPNLANIYVWNENTSHYIWVGDNTLDLGNYYTKQEGENFEQTINERVESLENYAYLVVDTTTYTTLQSFLATTGNTGYIYLYPVNTSDLTKGYYQYIWSNNSWLLIGTTTIDLAELPLLENKLINDVDYRTKFITKKNLFPIVPYTEGGFYGTTNYYSSNADYSYTDILSLNSFLMKAGSTYIISTREAVSYQVFVNFYDKEQNFISGVVVGNKIGTYQFTIPSGAFYFRLSFETTIREANILQIELGTNATYFESPNSWKLIEDIDANGHLVVYKDMVEECINILNKDLIIVNHIYVSGTWVAVSNNNGAIYPYIRVKAGVTYYYANLYAYFCIINYDDGTHGRVESSDTSVYKWGSFTPEKDGVVGITIGINGLNTLPHLLTESQRMYQQSIFENTYFPKRLKDNLYDYYVGSTRQYTRLRDAVDEAIRYPNSRIFVDSEEFDLCQEFATEIANNTQSQYGIPLGNGIHITFAPGCKVKALHAGNNVNVETYFAPFYLDTTRPGGFTLENLDISASNTRYCVHDEAGGASGIIVNKYINCRMEMDDTNTVNHWYRQCIGGGCGKNSYVYITNCYFKTKYAETAQAWVVSYHNGNNDNAQSNIFISNCYLADNGAIKFSYYGSSTKLSRGYVNNCSYKVAPWVGYEIGGATTPQNFELIAYANEVRS